MLTLNKIQKTLLSYLLLPKGWDDEDSVPPTLDHTVDALNFINLLYSHKFNLLQPMLSSNGKISFYYDSDLVFIDISIEDNNKISYYTRNKINNDESGLDDVDIYPDSIVQYLKLIGQ